MVLPESNVLTPDFLARLQRRFPLVDESKLARLVEDHGGLSRHLAERHDLTVLEAREELQDFLGLERLSAQVRDASCG
ncbi:hypothetical protein [Tropicibacter sp. S64]|uniref:hypothetical protein n=1 Tax=Tropicibacter sp. S64 TaxID=3415122 RepID=UPI003C79DF7A